MPEPGGAKLLALGLAVAASGWPHAAAAGVWNLEPALSASTEYATNPLLRPDQPASGSALVANLGLPAEWDDGAVHFEVAPRARVAHATGDSPIGANAYYLSTLLDSKSERADWSASFRWGDDSSAVREPAAGTLLRTNVRERFIDSGTNWSGALLERTQATVGLSWQELRYARADAAGLGLFDYRYETATGQLTQAWSERAQLQLVALASHYQLPATGYGENSYSLQAGIAGDASRIWTYRLQLGVSRLVESQTRAAASGNVFVASLNRTGLRSGWALSLTKSIQPSGFGTLASALEATTAFQWHATERLTYSATARWVDTTSSFRSDVIADRTYRALSAATSFRASEVWDLGGTVSWQSSAAAATAFQPRTAGHGFGVVVTAERRFGRLNLS
jgi:hypothetical protein